MTHTLKIGGHKFEVVTVDGSAVKALGGVGDCGVCDRETNRIVIDSSLPKSQQEETLIHEILHALNSSLQHELVDSLAGQLYQVLVDNDLLKDPFRQRIGI